MTRDEAVGLTGRVMGLVGLISSARWYCEHNSSAEEFAVLLPPLVAAMVQAHGLTVALQRLYPDIDGREVGSDPRVVEG